MYSRNTRSYGRDLKAAPPEFKSQCYRWYHWYDRVDIADDKREAITVLK